MKKILLFQIALLLIISNAISQNPSAKEKAEALARDEFSKAKYKKKEKFGVVKETKRVIESTPVVKENASFYNGVYVYQDLNYKIEIRADKQAKPIATLSIANRPDILLKEVSITDALFHAVKQNADGTKELWDGVFINRNDDGNTEFGLGIKLANPVQLTEGLTVTRIFLKKVSP